MESRVGGATAFPTGNRTSESRKLEPDRGSSSHGPRDRVDYWRHVVKTCREPLVKFTKPLHVLMKARFCDTEAQELQEQLLDLADRNMEGTVKLLDYLLNENNKTDDELAARWSLFEQALKTVHPNLYEIIVGQCDPDLQQEQRALLNFFMEDITKCVDPMHLLPGLYSRDLLNQEDCERLQCQRELYGPAYSAIYMVCNIHRINPLWYSEFLGLMMDENYEEMVKEIDEDAYNKKKEQTALKTSTGETFIGTAAEEKTMKVCGEAYESKAYQCGVAPPLEKHDNGDPCPANDSEIWEEDTVRKQYYMRTEEEEESDSEAEDDESFHSLDESFDLDNYNKLHRTKRKGVFSVTNDATEDPGSASKTTMNVMGENDFGNAQRLRIDGNVGRENFMSMEAVPEGPDNSNEEVDGGKWKEQEEVQAEPLKLRPYQEELARRGMDGNNVIVVAPTGSGKTLVAIKIMQHHLEKRGAGVRKVVFLVNQVALAQQQYEGCRKYLTDFRIKHVTGNAGAAATEKVPLMHLVMRADILVMTAQILLNALDQKELDSICQFSMIVFDECHHTNQQHPFNSIMHHYMDVKFSQDDDRRIQLPQVVGLTASVGVGKAGNQEQARKHIQKLCAHLDADYICTVNEHREELARYSNDPKYDQQICTKRLNDRFQRKIEEIMKTIEDRVETSDYLEKEDTEELKKKLKCRPHIRGTSAYSGWVSELVKTIAMMDNAEGRRCLESSRRMIKFYNDSLIINNECETEDALDFLRRQMDEVYDPMGKRTTPNDLFLKELFVKNLRYLEEVSREQRDTNPMLNKLEGMLIKAFGDEPDSRAMVFVMTRDLATALLKWMLRKPSLKWLKPGKMVGAGPSVDRGGMTKPQQVDVMQYFQDGDHKVMVATSVAEEGLDIRKCNLVIRYNHVTNEIAMVQARGRARAENSQFVTLASRDKGVQAKEEVNIIREMMMHEAIRNLQREMIANHGKFCEELIQIQREEKTKRDVELSLRSVRQLRQGEVVFRCRSCDAFAFMSSDVRKIDGIHHVVVDVDYRLRNFERSFPPKEHGNIQVRGTVWCKHCGERWGSVFSFQNVRFPGIQLEGFKLIDENDRKDILKRWKQTRFIVNELQPEEMEEYRRKAITVGYVN